MASNVTQKLVKDRRVVEYDPPDIDPERSGPLPHGGLCINCQRLESAVRNT
jgi:hypothetical protein